LSVSCVNFSVIPHNMNSVKCFKAELNVLQKKWGMALSKTEVLNIINNVPLNLWWLRECIHEREDKITTEQEFELLDLVVRRLSAQISDEESKVILDQLKVERKQELAAEKQRRQEVIETTQAKEDNHTDVELNLESDKVEEKHEVNSGDHSDEDSEPVKKKTKRKATSKSKTPTKAPRLPNTKATRGRKRKNS